MSRLTTHSKGSDFAVALRGAAARPEHSYGATATGVRTRDVAPLVTCSGSAAGHRRGALRPKIRRARPQRTPPGPGRRWNATAATPPPHRERSPTGPHSARQPQVHLFSGRLLSESCVLHDSQGRARPRCCLISVTACWSSTIESSSFLHFTASRKHFIAISSSAPLTLLRRVSTMSWL